MATMAPQTWPARDSMGRLCHVPDSGDQAVEEEDEHDAAADSTGEKLHSSSVHGAERTR